MSIVDFAFQRNEQFLIDRHINKEKWILNAEFTKSQKRVFLKQFDSATILYSIPVAKTELQVIEIMLKYPSRYQSEFSRVIHQSIPYPIVLVENYKDEQFKISVALTHTNALNNKRDVIEKRNSTPWCSGYSAYNVLLSVFDLAQGYVADKKYLETELIEIISKHSNRMETLNESENLYVSNINDIIEEYWVLTEKRKSFTVRLENILKQLEEIFDELELMQPYFDDNDLNFFDKDDLKLFEREAIMRDALLDEISEMEIILNKFSGDDFYSVYEIYERCSEIFKDYDYAQKTIECFQNIVEDFNKEKYDV